MEIPTFEKLQRANSPVMGRVSGAATSPIAQLVIQEDIGERDGDDSSAMSLNSADEALIMGLRKGLAEGIPETRAPVQVCHPMPVMYAEEGLGHGVTKLSPSEKNFAPDNGIHSNLDIDLAEFDFATGGVIESEDEAGPGEASGLAGISERTDNKSIGFTDAMAVRPRTNEALIYTAKVYGYV